MGGNVESGYDLYGRPSVEKQRAEWHEKRNQLAVIASRSLYDFRDGKGCAGDVVESVVDLVHYDLTVPRP